MLIFYVKKNSTVIEQKVHLERSRGFFGPPRECLFRLDLNAARPRPGGSQGGRFKASLAKSLFSILVRHLKSIYSQLFNPL